MRRHEAAGRRHFSGLAVILQICLYIRKLGGYCYTAPFAIYK